MSAFKVVCKTCNSDNVTMTLMVMSNGKPRAKGRCNDCFQQDNIAQNEMPEEAIMPYGKYKGKTIADIVAEDRSYADWMLDNGHLSGPLAEKFVLALGGS